MKERDLQRRIQKLIDSGGFRKAIVGGEAIERALAQSRGDQIWPRYPVDYLSHVRVAEAAHHVLGRLESLEAVTESSESLSLAKSESMYTDLLYCSTEDATFVLLELKVGDQTPRQAVTELLAYEQEILNHCPFLSHDDLVFILLGTSFRTTVDHALAGMMTWSRRRVLCLRAEPHGNAVRLHVHLPQAWSPIGQGILPANAISTGDLCFYPRSGVDEKEVEALAVTAMDLIVREADRHGSHGFAMLWDDAMYPEVTQSKNVLTVGVVNPFAFLPSAIQAGILPSDGTGLQQYLLHENKFEDLGSAHRWMGTIGDPAIRYLEPWCEARWEGLSSWDSLRQVDRMEGPVHLLERRSMPRAFDFFGIVGEHARDLTARPALRSRFVPSTVRPGVDWRHPRLGAAILDAMTLPEVVPMGQWTFGALFELGQRLGRFGSLAETYRRGDARTKTKVAARLFWSEADLWEPLHALRDRIKSTEDITGNPPTLVFGGYESGREIGAEVETMAQWIADYFIGNRSRFLKTAFILGLEGHGLYDAAFNFGARPSVKRALISKLASAVRGLVSASADVCRNKQASSKTRSAFYQLLAQYAGVRTPGRLSHEKLSAGIAELSDATLMTMLPNGLIPVIDTWCPQLSHRLVPAALAEIDWKWIKGQIAALRSQGMKHPGIMISPNAEVGTGDLSAYGPVLPVLRNPEKEVLVSIHSSGAELFVVMPWTEIEKHGFTRIEKQMPKGGELAGVPSKTKPSRTRRPAKRRTKRG